MKEKASKKPSKVPYIIIAVAFVLVATINILLNVFSGHVDLYLGRGEAIISQAEGTENWDSQYYVNDYSSPEDTAKAAAELVETLESEGIVLMKNNGALPLATSASNKTKITLLGRDAVDPVYSGSGSGSVDLSSVIDLKKALENAQYEINDTVYSVLNEYASFTVGSNQFGAATREYTHPKANIVMDKPEESNYRIGEMPVTAYTPAAQASFASYGDAAIIMYGRGGGEGGDLAKDMKGSDDNYVEGQHQLELNKDEKDLLELAKANFKTVIVLINSSSAMELGPLANDDGVDAILWIGSPGQTGFNAVGKVLNGTVNPSGRTADIYPSDFTKDPTFVNFGFYQYSNINDKNAIGNAYFVQYEEGIYYGYRYYETAAAEGFINYDTAVVYPFGYGLSYTKFDWEVLASRLGDVNGQISIDVRVTNTGSVAGKDVVQLYFAPPYTKGGIEKSAVVLGDFAKTDLLEPGESQTLTLNMAVENMASYDYKNNKAYVLDAGNYGLRIQTDSHNMKPGIEEITYKVPNTIVYSGNNHRPSDVAEVSNEFDDVSALFSDSPKAGYITNMSRSDFAGTFPTAPTEADYKANDDIVKGFQAYVAAEHEDKDAVMPTTGAKNGLSLINLRGVDYTDPLWDMLLDQLSPEEVVSVVTNSAYNTAAIESVGKPATVDFDGPAGISAFMGNTHGTAYPSEVVIAATFNTDLVKAMGVMLGNEGLALKVNGWYAPALNIHRSPFAGRNFEYYSEDPVLSGKIGASVVEGTASKGMYAFVKHFALNDQETNRVNNGVSTWANEQAIREIYLKPFEIIVKNAKSSVKYISDDKGTLAEKPIKAATAFMSSFNRIGATWSGGNPALQTKVLRDEWGFDGVVISDFNLYPYMYVNQGLAAGTDINITFSSMKTIEDKSSATAVSNLRKSAHNFLYTVANSNAMNGIVPGSTVTYTLADWVKVTIVVDIIIVLVLILSLVLVIRKSRKAAKE